MQENIYDIIMQNTIEITTESTDMIYTLTQTVLSIGLFWALFAAIAGMMQTYGKHKSAHAGECSRSTCTHATEPYNSAENYRLCRIRNLSVSVLHSLLSGGASLTLIALNPYMVQVRARAQVCTCPGVEREHDVLHISGVGIAVTIVYWLFLARRRAHGAQ
jgi:hypothetical protein